MLRLSILMNLIAYATLVSQPLFYIIALTNAQRGLSGSAYVELRQRINAVMSRRVPVLYGATVVTVLALLVLSWRAGSGNVLVTTIVGFLCLVVDIVLMLRENVPINGVMDRWSIPGYPEDWAAYRDRWLAIFGYRQVVLLVGFVSLLVGAVFQT
jgi:hypothetical protein